MFCSIATAYIKIGMGTVSESIAKSARASGAEIICNATVKKIITKGNKVKGVLMSDGSEIYADTVLSGCSPYHTFLVHINLYTYDLILNLYKVVY